MDYKFILGITATIIAFMAYIPYFRDISRNKTKPHAFTWLVWSVLTAIGFAGQIIGGGGSGAWITGTTSLICFSVFIAGLIYGQKNIVFADWLSLIGAGIALIFWYLTKSPLWSVVLISLIDALGFIPTFRKSFAKPYQETLSTYFIEGFAFILAILALEKFTVITSLYPLSVTIMNWLFISMLYIRRKQLKKA